MTREHSDCHSGSHCCKEPGPAVRGFLIPCLLFFLKDAPSHGYQLIERLQSSGYLREVPDPGVIYRHLRKLEQDEMVTSEFAPGDGPARKVYTITDQGLTHLTAWLDEMKHLNSNLTRFLTDAG